MTTVQGASAAVQGIEAAIRGDIGVRSCRNCTPRWAVLRWPTGRGFRPAAGGICRRRGPLICVGIDPHRNCWRRGDCRAVPTGWPGSAKSVCGPTRVSRWSSPRSRSSKPTARPAWRCWSAPPRHCGPTGAGPGRRQTRRHRIDHGRLRAGLGGGARWRPMPSPPRPTWVSARSPRCWTSRRPMAGVFVLAATSNPEGAGVQRALVGGRTVAQSVVDAAAAVNRAGARSRARWGGDRCHPRARRSAGCR